MPNLDKDFMSEMNLLTIIFPYKMIPGISLEDCINNKNTTLLVIEDMCLGLILPNHISKKFSYIQNAIKYGDFEEAVTGGMRVITVTTEWDTSKWSMYRISKFYDVLGDIELLNVEQINNRISWKEYTHDIRSKIDLNS